MTKQIIVPVIPHISGHGHADPKSIIALYIVLCVISLPSFIYTLYRWRKDKEFLGLNIGANNFVLSWVFIITNLVACVVCLTFIVKSFL